ncbi:hypothetical protein GF373_00970, partial [bacterium]|nr:hypothetical protein [bacterium]
DGESYILGGRVAGDITPDFAYKGEVAYQFQDNNIAAGPEADAFAGQIGINYHPEYNMNPNIGFIYTYLQEDNGSGFIAPFDGKTFGMIHEGLYKVYNGAGGFTNSHVFNVNGGFEPMQDVAWTADFFYFMADDDIAGTNEDDGGFEIDSQIDYQFNEYLRTFLGGGVYFPGDAAEAAFGNNDDQAYFFRTGMKVNF